MSEALGSILLGTAGLDVAAALALYLTVSRGNLEADSSRVRAAVRVVGVVICLQAAHFAEELATGFQVRFPELLGLAAWPREFFVTFNLAWIAIWALGAAGLWARLRAALFPVWFLAIGSAMNGIAHPVFALLSGGYFPGLVTSPFVGIAGVLLLRSLFGLTARAPG